MFRKILFSFMLLALTATASAGDVDWKVYASYHNPTKCVALGDRIYVLANGDLYSYDPQDQSIETYDKATVLSDFGIYDIQLSANTNELIVLYTNGNIDLLSTNGTVFNMSELKSKTLSDKTLNDVLTNGNTLYISTNAGLVELDLRQRIFKNLYDFGFAVKSICLDDGYILAATNGGVYRGSLSVNLLDPANWEKVGSASFTRILKQGSQLYAMTSQFYKVTSVSPFRISQVSADRVANLFQYGDYIYYTTTAGDFKSLDEAGNLAPPSTPYPINNMVHKAGTYWAACGTNGFVGMSLSGGNEFTQKVSDITPNSPVRNNFYSLEMEGERLLATGGNFYYPNINCTGTVMKYEGGRWLAFDEEGPAAAVQADAYTNAISVAQDPGDPEHHWVSTRTSGVYEFRDYKYASHYDSDNSVLRSILPNSASYYKYVWVSALAFDKQRNLWMCNNECDTILCIRKADGSWLKYYYDDIAGYPTFDHILFDKRGWAWINSRRTTSAGAKAGIFVINTNGTINTQRDDTYRFHYTLTNQDGLAYGINELYDIVEDLDGAMWIGTEKGIFTSFDPANIFNSGYQFTQVKISREDGTGLADYLLSGVPVTCIAIDGANRKWIGTGGSGLYLLSADGQQTLYRFTKDDSPLISDNINDIAINGETGEVFFATDKGLCSFIADAVDAEEELDKNNIKVYPNPVRPEDRNLVRVTGLAFNTNVKIANAAGRLVYEGTSNGGEFTWNCKTSGGKQVASGIYYILATDSDGKKGASAKVLIVR